MKKITALFLTAVLALGLLAGCGSESGGKPASAPQGDGGSSGADDPAAPAVFTSVQNAHTYTLSTLPDGSDGQPTKRLTVTETASGKEIQTLTLTGNEWFSQEPLYLTDISFDGKTDILVPHALAAGGAYFRGYIWNEKSRRYVYAPTLETVPNVVVDTAAGQLLSHRTADRATFYGIYAYSAEQQDVTLTKSLYWEPQEDERYMQVTESAYTAAGEKKELAAFSVAAVNVLGVDKNAPPMAPYYADDSLWALDNGKWENTLFRPQDSLL